MKPAPGHALVTVKYTCPQCHRQHQRTLRWATHEPTNLSPETLRCDRDAYGIAQALNHPKLFNTPRPLNTHFDGDRWTLNTLEMDTFLASHGVRVDHPQHLTLEASIPYNGK